MNNTNNIINKALFGTHSPNTDVEATLLNADNIATNLSYGDCVALIEDQTVRIGLVSNISRGTVSFRFTSDLQSMVLIRQSLLGNQFDLYKLDQVDGLKDYLELIMWSLTSENAIDKDNQSLTNRLNILRAVFSGIKLTNEAG